MSKWCSRFMQFLVVIITFLSLDSKGQNLVPNNGFETNDGTPTGYGQWYHATGWSDVNNYPAFLWPYASPDYLHNTGAGGADLPVCTFGTVSPFAGNAVMGFVTWLQSTPDFREYLSIPLSSPMIVGTAYNVSFWITNGSASWYNGYSSNRIGARFSIGTLTQATHEPIGGTPQCELVTDLWTTTWQYVSFVYTPDQAYNQITIGNFYNDASTSHSYHVASLSAGAYYFIDEVVVEPAVPLPVELLAFEAVQTDHGADISWNTASEFDVSSYVVSRSSDGVNFNPLGEISATGNATTSADYLLLDDEPLFGNNYYQLEVINLNGEVDETYLTALYVDGTASRPVIYPNPSRGSVTISIPIGLPLAGIQIFDISGRLIREIDTLSATVPIGINDLSTGTYVIKFISTIDIDNQLLIVE